MRRTPTWTTPADIVGHLEHLWQRGQLPASAETAGLSFPLSLRCHGPKPPELADRYDEVRRWVRSLAAASRPAGGRGYDIEWAEINHRQLGRNRLPWRIIVPTLDDALHLIDRHAEAACALDLATVTAARFPALADWSAKNRPTLLARAAEWPAILRVLDWFRAHPRPGLYLRQLDIAGVDSKFIETRKALLTTLLDLVLPEDAIDRTAIGSAGFERRYGLQAKPPLVRFRLLDERLAINGLSDLTVPADQFARASLPVSRVFITENEINGLAFPDVRDALVVFGLGYGLGLLAEARWLSNVDLAYWGDIDTHGLAILDRLRTRFPHARSLLMDVDTLRAHQSLWGTEADRHTQPLPRLTRTEQDLYADLLANRFGDAVRLEQERIAFGWVTRALQGP
jgi:hypothetical protein